MATTARLNVEVKCKVCSETALNLWGCVLFYWGKIPADYGMGDAIGWAYEDGKLLRPFTWSLKYDYSNFGDPAYGNLLAFEADPNFPTHARVCEQCNSEYEGIAVRIKGGAICAVELFLPGEVEALIRTPWMDADIVLQIDEDTYVPRPDWNDPQPGV